MNTLAPLDFAVVALYLAAIFAVGLVVARRAGSSMESFFVAGRTLPWWLAGVSMAATNFSIDTPIAITELVFTEGIPGVWFTWANGISALLVTFLFARLWRRSGVLTDAEIVELRYGGRPAAALRLFKGFYFGVIFNAFIMGWVFLALIKVMGGLVDIDLTTLLVVTTALVFVYTVTSGFYGVVYTDFLQYFVALAGSSLLAIFAVRAAGGPAAMVARVSETFGAEATRFAPRLSLDSPGPLSLFLTYALVQWWAHKYADGGGKHIQRMLSTRSEGHAFAASLLYSFLNYTVQVWPWIVTALAAMALFGQLADPQLAYAMTIAEVLPPGLAGLALAGLLGAFMSTIDSHLNLGASYMVNDIYRRFLVRGRSERHYVLVSRLMMAVLLGLAVVIALNIESVAGAWKFLLTFASGAGLTWIVRWFWWRVNAWSELSAMVTSGAVATALELLRPEWLYSAKLGTTVAVTTVVWLAVTLATPPVDRAQLAKFHARVRPGRAGWRRIASVGAGDAAGDRFLGRALLQWVLALGGFFGLNFGLGALLLGRAGLAAGLLVAAAAALSILGLVVRGSGSSRTA